MSTSKQSLDDFLGEQETNQSALLATIDMMEGHEQLVKITPFTNEGCGCHNSLLIPKETIEWVEKTGQSHDCCGSTHAVVKVGFKEGSSILLADLFEQLNKSEKPEIILPGGFDTLSSHAMPSENFSSTDHVPANIPFCKPAYPIAQSMCILKRNGKFVQGAKTLTAYTNPYGRICKTEWGPCM